MEIRTHRDNWSSLTTLERAGVQLERGRFKDVALELGDPEVRAELVRASATRSIEVAEGARAELEAHGLTVTAAGAVVELPAPAELGELEAGDQVVEAEPGPAAAPPMADGDPLAEHEAAAARRRRRRGGRA